MKKTFYIGFTFTILLFFACGDTTLEGYKPKDQNEADIKALLVKYKDAIESDNIPQFLSCFSKDGRFEILYGRLLTKDELSDELPLFFSKWATVDISHIKFSVKDATAQVKVREKVNRTSGHENLGLNKQGFTYFDLIRENNEWLIVKTSKN